MTITRGCERGIRATLILSAQSVALLSVAPAVAATTDRPPMGAEVMPQPLSGQQIEHVTCPAHSVMTGLREVLGYWLYMAWPICQPINGSGAWAGKSGWKDPPLASLSNSTNGAWDFQVLNLNCPAGSYAAGFSGIMVMAKDGDQVFPMPGLTTLICHQNGSASVFSSQPEVSDWLRPQSQGIFASFDAPQVIRWFDDSEPSACPLGQVGVGVWGIRDQWLRTIGLTCSALSDVRGAAIQFAADAIALKRTAPQVPAVEVRAAVLDGSLVSGGLRSSPPVGTVGTTAAGSGNQSNVGQPTVQTSNPLATSSNAYDQPGIGDPSSGLSVRELCMANSAVSATVLVVNGSMLEMNPICSAVQVDGRLSAKRTPAYGVPPMRQKGWSIGDNSVLTNRRESTCPTGDYVVGYSYGVAYLGGKQYPWHVFAECWNPSTGAYSSAPYAIAPSELDAEHEMLAWDGISGAATCRQGDVAVGAWGMITPDLVQAVGLVCKPLSSLRPVIRPVTDKATPLATRHRRTLRNQT